MRPRDAERDNFEFLLDFFSIAWYIRVIALSALRLMCLCTKSITFEKFALSKSVLTSGYRPLRNAIFKRALWQSVRVSKEDDDLLRRVPDVDVRVFVLLDADFVVDLLFDFDFDRFEDFLALERDSMF
jgi:hypothetical protein